MRPQIKLPPPKYDSAYPAKEVYPTSKYLPKDSKYPKSGDSYKTKKSYPKKKKKTRKYKLTKFIAYIKPYFDQPLHVACLPTLAGLVQITTQKQKDYSGYNKYAKYGGQNSLTLKVKYDLDNVYTTTTNKRYVLFVSTWNICQPGIIPYSPYFNDLIADPWFGESGTDPAIFLGGFDDEKGEKSVVDGYTLKQHKGRVVVLVEIDANADGTYLPINATNPDADGGWRVVGCGALRVPPKNYKHKYYKGY